MIWPRWRSNIWSLGMTLSARPSTRCTWAAPIRPEKTIETWRAWRCSSPGCRRTCPAERAFQRTADIYDTTIGWRFVNAQMKASYGVDSMPETGENVAADFNVSREDQDAFAWRSQQRAARARDAGVFAAEIVPVIVPQAKGAPAQIIERDEQ